MREFGQADQYFCSLFELRTRMEVCLRQCISCQTWKTKSSLSLLLKGRVTLRYPPSAPGRPCSLGGPAERSRCGRPWNQAQFCEVRFFRHPELMNRSCSLCRTTTSNWQGVRAPNRMVSASSLAFEAIEAVFDTLKMCTAALRHLEEDCVSATACVDFAQRKSGQADNRAGSRLPQTQFHIVLHLTHTLRPAALLQQTPSNGHDLKRHERKVCLSVWRVSHALAAEIGARKLLAHANFVADIQLEIVPRSHQKAASNGA